MKYTLLIISFLIPALLHSQNLEKQSSYDEKANGFYDVTTISFSPFYPPVANGFLTVNGYKINPHLAVGMGIGMQRYVNISTYDTIRANLSVLPVFLDLRYTVSDRIITPVFALNGGYLFLLNRPSSAETFRTQMIFPPNVWNDYYDYDHYNQGGLYFNLELGLKVKMSKLFSLVGSMNYSWWQIYGEHRSAVYQNLPDGNNGTKQIVLYSSEKVMAYINTWTFRIGLTF